MGSMSKAMSTSTRTVLAIICRDGCRALRAKHENRPLGQSGMRACRIGAVGANKVKSESKPQTSNNRFAAFTDID